MNISEIAIHLKRILCSCLIAIIVLVINTHTVKGQQLTLKGTVVDSLTTKPIPFASVYLLGNGGQKKTAVSNESGQFRIGSIAPGEYSVSVNQFNYYLKTLVVSLVDTPIVRDIGLIAVVMRIKALKEVKITAQNMITQSADRLKYNVEKDPQSSSASVLNIIEKVPLLSVDGVGNIKYQGGSSFRVFIDGKPSVLMDRNASEILKNMSASSIQSIEVITTPPEKYISENVTGIINIITRKKVENGYEGAVNIEYRTPAGGIAAGSSLAIKAGRFTASAYLGYSHYEKPPTSRDFSRIQYGANPTVTNQTGTNKTSSDSKYINADLNYEIDSLNLLSGRIGLYDQKNIDQAGILTQLNELDGQLIQQYNVNNFREASWRGLEAGIDYQRNFAKIKGKSFTASYLYTKSLDKEADMVLFDHLINYTGSNYNQHNRFDQDEHSIQLDFIQQSKKLKFNIGVKGIARLGSGNFITFNDKNSNLTPDFSNLYKNNQYIPSLYNSFQYGLSRWSFIAGYRLEYTSTNSTQNLDATLLERHYLSFIPNFTTNFKVNESETVNFIYNNTIRRPNISYLNPFVNKLNPNLEIAGNPYLLPVRINTFSIQYRRFKKTSIIIGASYAASSNIVQQVLTNTDSIGVSRLTYYNVGKKQDWTLTLNYNAALTKLLNLNLSGNLIYTSLSGLINKVNVVNSGVTGDVNLGLNYSLTKTVLVTGRFSYSAPNIYLQGQANNYPYFIFSGSKLLLNKRLSLTATLINPFSKYRYVTQTYAGVDFSQSSHVEYYYRTVLLKASYKFGQVKSSRKNDKTIKNNDAIGIR